MAEQEAKIGAAAGLAGLLSFGSFVLTCTGRPTLALIAAIIALPAGALGFLLAASPKRRGGILSLISIVVGLMAVGVAALGMMGKLAEWMIN